MKKRLDYNLETSEESEQSSDSDRPGPSHRKHGKKSVGGSRKGKGKVNVETESVVVALIIRISMIYY